GHAGCHAWTVREPLDQRRDRRDIADAEAAATEHAIADIDEPKCVSINADRGQKKSAGPAQSGGEHGATRAAVLHPAAENRGRSAEKHHRNREDPAEFRKLPIAWRRLRDTN